MSNLYIIDLKKGFRGVAETVVKDGKILWSDAKTIDEYKKLNPHKKVEVWNEEKMNRELNLFLNGMCNDWKEITDTIFFNAMEELPPKRFTAESWGYHFFLGEAYIHDVRNYFISYANRYYTSFQRLSYNAENIKTNFFNYLDSIGIPQNVNI